MLVSSVTSRILVSLVFRRQMSHVRIFPGVQLGTNVSTTIPTDFAPGVGQSHQRWTTRFAALITRARDPPSRANRRLPPGSLDLSTMVAIAPKGQQLARRPAQPRQTFRSRTPLPAPCRKLPLLL